MTIQTETVVIGAGPGGYVAAIRAAQLGQQVTIVEAKHIGGVCLNVGCIPSKALITAGHRYQEAQKSAFLGVQTEKITLDFEQTQHWKNQKVVQPLTAGITSLLKKNKVKIITGEARFISKNSLEITNDSGVQQLNFKQGIIATGSRPIEIKGFPFGGRIVDSTGGLNLPELPKKLVIIGGGYIGCELAGAYASLGSSVTVIEGSPSILPNFEADIQGLVSTRFQKNGVTVITNAQAKQALQSKEGVVIEYVIKDQVESIQADIVMVTVGRRPNTDKLGLEMIGVEKDQQGLIMIDDTCQTTQPTLFAIGDVVEGPALAHKASYEGKVVAEVLSGKNVKKDYRAIPAICFTDPEIATVGLTCTEAKAQGIQVKSASFPVQANGRALSLNATEGFIRIVFEEETELVLGAQIASVNASDLIAEITLAIESYLTLEDIALTIHGHPTLAEMVMDVSEVGLGLPIHM